MLKPKRLVILSVIIGCLAFIGAKVWDYVWTNRLWNNPQALLELVPEAALQVKNFHRSNIEDGRKTWEISGDEAGYFKAEEKAVIQRPKLSFYQKNGDVISARGNQGQVFLSNGDVRKVVLSGAVEIHYQKMSFLTDELIYLHASNQVIAPGKIRATFEGIEVEGSEMELSLTEERMKLKQSVKTIIQPELLRSGGLMEGLTQHARVQGGRT
jgi:LPS export ABC transporter protein LptC